LNRTGLKLQTETSTVHSNVTTFQTSDADNRSVSRLRIIGLVSCFLILLASLFINLTTLHPNLFYRRLLNDSHFLLFVLLGFIILKLLNIKSHSIRAWPGRNFVWAIVWGIVVAVGTEFLQLFTTREFEWRDMLLNSAGVLFINGIIYFWFNQSFQTKSRPRKMLFRGGFVVVFILFFVPLINNWYISFYNHLWAQSQQPLLASFEDQRELHNWVLKELTQFEIVPRHATHGKYALKITAEPTTYPGVIFEYLYSDWHRYRVFKFSAYNPSSTPIELYLRIDEGGSDYTAGNRVYLFPEILPGQNEINIPLTEIVKNASKGTFNLANVARVIFFLNRPMEETVFYVDNIRLE